jgi:NTE family protein
MNEQKLDIEDVIEQLELSVPKEALLTFQGGGAKGIVHVGALMAVEEFGTQIRGVAGTSAGAIVAALVACGYKAKELLNPDDSSHILQKLGKTLGYTRATSFFGPSGWFFISMFRRVAGWPECLVLLLAAVVVGWAIFDYGHPLVAAVVLLCICLVLFLFAKWVIGGITTVERVRDFVDRALALKLAETKHSPIPQRAITFRHLRESGGLPLKIVATNITEETGEVFSFERTPDVAVADAVAASICLPVIFRPWKFRSGLGHGVSADLRECRFQDGGMISNLPVWTLDRERREYPEISTFAFSIHPERPDEPTETERHWLGAVVGSIVSGSVEIDTREVEALIHVPIKSKLGLVQFDADLPTLCQSVREAYIGVKSRLTEDCVRYPALLSYASDRIRAGVEGVLGRWLGTFMAPGFQMKVKCALAMQDRGEYLDYYVSYGSGYSDLPDLGASELSLAWESDVHKIEQIAQGVDWAGPFWRLLVPVSSRGAPGQAALINGRPERPLLLVIEFEIPDFEPGSGDERRAFDRMLSRLADSMIDYCLKEGLNKVVQRMTSLPWQQQRD